MKEKSKKKKILIISIAMIVAAISLAPVKNTYKDGGTVSFKSLIYEFTIWHAMTSRGTEIGPELKIFGITVYEDVHTFID